MEKVIFVILHYLTYIDTIECVESIESNIDYSNYEIVIIDNNSNNKSYEKLKEKYEKNKKVYLINNKENLGFAKANNIAYAFAKNKLKADFIITINNDTVIEDKNFITKIISIFKTEKYYLLGPDIISLRDQQHQNPLAKVLRTKEEVTKSVIKLNILLLLKYMNLAKVAKKVISILKKIKNKDNNQKRFDEKQLNVPLHGSCIVFSPLFIKRFNNAFYSETFLYIEEDILFYICTKLKLKIVYHPEIKIFHKEDSSTDYFMKNNDVKKEAFIFKNIRESTIEFYKLIHKYEKNKTIDFLN